MFNHNESPQISPSKQKSLIGTLIENEVEEDNNEMNAKTGFEYKINNAKSSNIIKNDKNDRIDRIDKIDKNENVETYNKHFNTSMLFTIKNNEQENVIINFNTLLYR
jgi:hypothetical protein